MLYKWGKGAHNIGELYELVLPKKIIVPYNTLKFPLCARGELVVYWKDNKLERVKLDLPILSEKQFEVDQSNEDYFERILESLRNKAKELLDKKVADDGVRFNCIITADDDLVIGEGHVSYGSLSELYEKIND